MAFSNPRLVKNNSTLFDTITFGLNWATDSEVRSELNNHFRLQEMVYEDTDEMKILLQDTADKSKDYLNRLYLLQTKISTNDYNPIENYNMSETETPAKIKSTHTPAETTLTDTPAETTVTDTPAEYTSTVTPSTGTTTSNNNIFGFNSSTAVGHDNSTVTTSNVTNSTDVITVQDSGVTKTETDTAGTSVLTVQESEETIIETITARTLNRHGNIGVMTASQMVQMEAQLAEVIFGLLKILCKQYDDCFAISLNLW